MVTKFDSFDRLQKYRSLLEMMGLPRNYGKRPKITSNWGLKNVISNSSRITLLSLLAICIAAYFWNEYIQFNKR